MSDKSVNPVKTNVEEIAQTTFDAIRKRAFYIYPDRNVMALAKERFESMIDQRNPESRSLAICKYVKAWPKHCTASARHCFPRISDMNPPPAARKLLHTRAYGEVDAWLALPTAGDAVAALDNH
jgi:hypothetical protein